MKHIKVFEDFDNDLNDRYKLIKKYPGSPQVGTVVEWGDDFFIGVDNEDIEVPKIMIEKYPEFWEKVTI